MTRRRRFTVWVDGPRGWQPIRGSEHLSERVALRLADDLLDQYPEAKALPDGHAPHRYAVHAA